MRKAIYRIFLLSVFLAAVALRTHAQASFHAYGCAEMNPILAREEPTIANHTFVPGRPLVDAKFDLNTNLNVRIVEYPRDSSGEFDFNSTILVNHGRQQNVYPLSTLIKGGNVFRAPNIVALCTSQAKGIIVMAFGTFATGDHQAFAVIQYSDASYRVEAFPIIATQGRLVLNRGSSGKAELWSVTSEDYGSLCGACDKHYNVYDCRIGEAPIKCSKRRGVVGPLPPDKFMAHPIIVK